MQKMLQQRVTVQPGGKVELICSELKAGQTVDVVVTPAPEPERRSARQSSDGTSRPRRSVLDILEEASGHLLFKTAQEVDEYIREERDSWDR